MKENCDILQAKSIPHFISKFAYNSTPAPQERKYLNNRSPSSRLKEDYFSFPEIKLAQKNGLMNELFGDSAGILGNKDAMAVQDH